ncbi:exo-alpha-sialidase [Mucilaginibacter sp. AW1-3]
MQFTVPNPLRLTTKNLRKPVCFIIAFLLSQNYPGYSKSLSDSLNFIFKSGENGYSCFRIPALICTKKGNLLAFAEGRKNDCGDSGDIDLVIKRSADNGKTWSKLQVVWSDSTNTCGNPVPVQDQSTGRIWLLSTWNLGPDHEKQINDGTAKKGRCVFTLHSDNDGVTWSAPAEITAQVKKSDWTWYATGPCHGLQITVGKFAGRLVIPVNHVENKPRRNFAHVIYSDDHGATWHLGANTPQAEMNETTVAEISGGRLMLNMRNGNRAIRTRHTSISPDGGLTWSAIETDTTLIEPVCQGSLLSYFYTKNKPTLFFINPANTKSRRNVTLRMSEDDGKTWKYNMVLYPGFSAYSDIAVLNKHTIACLFEAGYAKANEGIVFKTVGYPDLKKAENINLPN